VQLRKVLNLWSVTVIIYVIRRTKIGVVLKSVRNYAIGNTRLRIPPAAITRVG
jgi:hypothetical protein